MMYILEFMEVMASESNMFISEYESYSALVLH